MNVFPFGELPTTPTVSIEGAADTLGISRALTYRLGNEYIDSGGVSGIPCYRLAGCLKVPTWALLELALKGRLVRLCDVDLRAELAATHPDLAASFPQPDDDQPNAPAKPTGTRTTRRPAPDPSQLAIDLDS